MLLEETKSPEIGLCLSTPLSDSAVTEETVLTREDVNAVGVTTEIKAMCRVLSNSRRFLRLRGLGIHGSRPARSGRHSGKLCPGRTR